MPLRFRRQLFSGPARKRRRLGMTHVYGPRKWQRNDPEHRSIIPLVIGICRRRTRSRQPEMWMFELLLPFPFPVFGIPVTRLFISARVDKFQILAIRNGESINGEAGNEHLLRVEFVVPAKIMNTF